MQKLTAFRIDQGQGLRLFDHINAVTGITPLTISKAFPVGGPVPVQK